MKYALANYFCFMFYTFGGKKFHPNTSNNNGENLMNNINGIGYVFNNGDKRQNPSAAPQEVTEEKTEQKAAETNLEETPLCVYGKALVNKANKPEWTNAVNNSIQDFMKNPELVEKLNENYEHLLEAGYTAQEALAFMENFDLAKYTAQV